ncbi:MAG: glycosyltransferase family 2 protein [Nitrospiraceae bacterium]|nr:MAG: glycosyltransferase family 2 protein [Nitrospiraceae bacterium]
MNSGLVILPAFNEEKFIAPVISGIKEVDGGIDILVIDDGSNDKTVEIAEELGAMVISHPYNTGYGAALQTGFRFAFNRNYDFALTIDADGQHDPESIPSILKSMNNTGADIVIGSRFLEGGYRMSFARRIGSWIFAGVARCYTGYRFTDPTSGFQLLNRRAFSYLSQEEVYPLDYPDVNIIMLLHKKQFKIIESPVRMVINAESDTMHSGMKPLVYVVRMLLAIIMILLRKED